MNTYPIIDIPKMSPYKIRKLELAICIFLEREIGSPYLMTEKIPGADSFYYRLHVCNGDARIAARVRDFVEGWMAK